MTTRDDNRLLGIAYRYDITGKAYIDGKGRLFGANPALCRLLRRESERLEGADVREIWPGRLGTAWDDPSIPQTSRLRIEPDGSDERWLDVTVLPIDADDESATEACALLQAADVTEQVRLEERIRALENDATKAHRSESLLQSEKLLAAGQLAAGIAHEIRNPLTSLKGFLQLLKAGTGSPAKRDAYLSIMDEELERIEQIAGELIVLSKPRSVHYTKTRLARLIRQTAALLQPQALLRKTEIVTLGVPDTAAIYCDENQIKQVLINLMKNGIEAMPRGGRLTVAAEADDERAVIRVADQGEGIPAEQLARLGQPFYTTKEHGTGLGLTVSFKIVENHGGRIDVMSEPGVGTAFTITLPADGSTAKAKRDADT